MKTTGQILKETRASKKLDIVDISRITRIRPRFLEMLEEDDYGHLPNATVARGFIRNYGEFLGINSHHLLAVFRRDFVENQQGRIVPRGMVDPVNKVSFWTPRTTIIVAVTLVFTLLGVYLYYQYRVLTGPPHLELSTPTDRVNMNEDTVQVVGRTDPEASLSVNGHLVALEKGGTFFFRMPLNPGENKITVTSLAKSGKTTTVIRIVEYSP